MRSRLAFGCALVFAASTPALAQDWFEPNPSLAELSADDAYARKSAKSLQTAGIDAAVAIRLDGEGRAIVAGGTDHAPRIVRLDADGRLDLTFGDAGVAEVPVWGFVAPGGLEVDAAGRIVVTGCFYEEGASPSATECTQPDFGAARLLADGSLDPSFSGDGLLEIDPASRLFGFGVVRASGADGAVLVASKKPMKLSGFDEIVAGVVRIAADGTIDATYGGGFAYIAKSQWGFYVASRADSVTDLDVDPAGRALVVLREADGGGFTVQRFDAAGGTDWTFRGVGVPDIYYVAGSLFAASQVALDGAERPVVVAGAGLVRLLDDGSQDPAFSGDGFAWNHAASAVGRALEQNPTACLYVRTDPDSDADPVCDGGLLAVATSADRWALAKLFRYRNAKGLVVARGIDVRAIDPADPGAIVSATYRSPDPRFSKVAGLAITPDGSAAYALGDTFVLRVGFTARRALPLPDLRAQWIGVVHARDLAGGRYRVEARVRIRNVSARGASVLGEVSIGDGSVVVPLATRRGSPASSRPILVRGRSSVVRRITWEGAYGPADLAGTRLSVRVWNDLPDPNFADNTATSEPLTPLYAPR